MFRILVACLFLVCSLASSSGGDDESPVVMRTLVWKSDRAEEMARIEDRSTMEDAVQESVQTVLTPHGNIAQVRNFRDPNADVWRGSLLDKASGWEAKLTVNSGLKELGVIESYDLDRVISRAEAEQPIVKYVLDLPDGRYRVELVDGPEDRDRDPLAELVEAALTDKGRQPIPKSVLEEVDFLEDVRASSVGRQFANMESDELLSILRVLGDMADAHSSPAVSGIDPHWRTEFTRIVGNEKLNKN